MLRVYEFWVLFKCVRLLGNYCWNFRQCVAAIPNQILKLIHIYHRPNPGQLVIFRFLIVLIIVYLPSESTPFLYKDYTTNWNKMQVVSVILFGTTDECYLPRDWKEELYRWVLLSQREGTLNLTKDWKNEGTTIAFKPSLWYNWKQNESDF